MKTRVSRIVAALLCLIMLVSTLPMTALAANDYTASTTDDYYNLVSKKDWELAPGVTESEIVLNNDSGTHRQVAHVVEVDINNEYTKVMPSYKGMAEGLNAKDYAVQVMSQQAAYAEANGYGNVVAAMNISLSWYDGQYYKDHPELVGEPLGYLVMDGVYYENSQGKTAGSQTCLVINFDEKDGVDRPSNIPKVEIRSTSDAITGWEEQVMPANFGFLVKDGKNQYSKDHTASNGASRSFVGIKADGTIVMVMNDGRQSPYSAGFTNYEMAEFMLSLGCVQAVNGDGGGSSTFLSQRPGEELKLNCSPSDGSERATTHGILVISTVPATGEFVRAQISAENEYYTLGSSVQFNAVGADAVGTAAEIPAGVKWQISDATMGTIDSNGLFVSSGKAGKVTAQLVYNDKVVGEATINIVVPEIEFALSNVVVSYGKSVKLEINATTNNGLNTVILRENDISLSLSDATIGSLDGFTFTARGDNATTNVTETTVTATYVNDNNITATAKIKIGKASEVVFDFEGENGIDKFTARAYYSGANLPKLYLADENSGMVHSGKHSMAFEVNMLKTLESGSYGAMIDWCGEQIDFNEAVGIGCWVYVPDEFASLYLRLCVLDRDTGLRYTTNSINTGDVVGYEESGWHYLYLDLTDHQNASIRKNNAFIEIYATDSSAGNYNGETYGTNAGIHTFYIDDITVDYSTATEDRDAPVFGDMIYTSSSEATTVIKKNTALTIPEQSPVISVPVAENTTKSNYAGLNLSSAKGYIDGVETSVSYVNGKLIMGNVKLADGYHTIKFSIEDGNGNYSSIVRTVKISAGTDYSTITAEVRGGYNASSKLLGGTLLWLDLKANRIESIDSITTTIDLNSSSKWELDHMEVAKGFTASYTIDTINNSATITITANGKNKGTGNVTLVALPIRMWYYTDTITTTADIAAYNAVANSYSGPKYNIGKYVSTPSELWGNQHPMDTKIKVDFGSITYVDGYTADCAATFGSDDLQITTEIYTYAKYMTAEEKASRTSVHVHTPTALPDKESTCTEDGYTGRTYCDVCHSIVDWGTTLSAKGHDVTYLDGLNTCGTCQKVFYYIDGAPASGWILNNGNYYYADDSGEASNGSATIGGHTYTFVNYILTDAAWENDGVALTAWWAGEQVFNQWFELNGKKYHFTGNYLDVGFKKIGINTNIGMRYHLFDENGVLQTEYTGIYEYDGNLHFVKNGIAATKGLVKDNDGNIYYVNSSYYVITNTAYNISEDRTNGIISAGTYTFGSDGKMIIPKNGLVADADGEIRYYVNNVATYAGLVKDDDGNYYYINSTLKAVKNTAYRVTKTNGLLDEDIYTFGSDGKMIIPKNGLVADADGEIRYYVNNVATYAGLVKDDDGNYYYINSTLKAVKNTAYRVTKTNGLLDEDIYTFGSDGKMIIPKNGLVADADGEIRYYVNNVATYAGLVKDDDGNYYYINSTLKAVKNTAYRVTKTNGLLDEDIYTFGSDGKMVQD